MRKSILLISAGIALLSSGTAFAGKATERCYQPTGFPDVFKLSSVDGQNPQQAVGSWSVPDDYFLPVSGSMETDEQGAKHVSLVGLNTSLNFGGNQICSADAIIGGVFSVQCSGGTAGNFQFGSDGFTRIKCPKSPSDVRAEKAAIGTLGRR